jgi:glycosyltransferase involved in cell wall biosynthesis
MGRAWPLRVCYFGTYRAAYARNRIMIEGLRRAGVAVIECHEPLWRGTEDRVQAASGGWLRPRFWWRLLHAYGRLLQRYARCGAHDILVVGYPGLLDVFVAFVVSRLRRKPLVWDIFMSVYLIALERGLDRRSGLSIGLLRNLERLACRLPDRLILDTEAYVAWFQTTHGVAAQRFRLVPTGADDRIFRPVCSDSADGLFRVIYYGSFIPNHGVEHIVEAARLLADDPTIRFELIGDGPDRARTQAMAQRYALSNVVFIDWLEPSALVARVARADVCLGAFGTTPQSLMTVHNKIYEGLAMAKPVITGDSPAVRQALEHGEHVFLCKRADAQSLADAVRVLRASPDLRARLAQRGHRLFCEQFDLQHNGQRFASHLRELVG